MEEEKKKAIEKEQQTIKPAGGKEEISPEDLDKVSGGLNPQPLPPGGNDRT
jgi:hypothetical protein